MRNNQPVTNVEVPLRDGTLIVSKTDLKGQITYVNREFLEISGFTEAEVMGQPHNILRHHGKLGPINNGIKTAFQLADQVLRGITFHANGFEVIVAELFSANASVVAF